jgi:hypothetical protein
VGEEVGFACSFCGKEQREVLRLVAGAKANICNECIVLCVSVMADMPPLNAFDLDILQQAQGPRTASRRPRPRMRTGMRVVADRGRRHWLRVVRRARVDGVLMPVVAVRQSGESDIARGEVLTGSERAIEARARDVISASSRR